MLYEDLYKLPKKELPFYFTVYSLIPGSVIVV